MTTRLPSGLTVCGRGFSEQDLELIRGIIADESRPCRAEIARRTCAELGWIGEGGRLKAMSCRVALIRLEKQGLVQLPPPRCGNGNGIRHRSPQKLLEVDQQIACAIDDLHGLQLRAVESKAQSRLWNEVVATFHYLGYRPLPGAQQRYLVESEEGVLGALGFGASAWKVAPRDEWIGWTSEQRRTRLHRVVNNARFLLLPRVRVKNLASCVLAMSARRIRGDWQRRYGYEPVLLETFVERSRFSGACYRAANWIYVGDTRGRGKLDRRHELALPVKRVFVQPLVKSWRQELCA